MVQYKLDPIVSQLLSLTERKLEMVQNDHPLFAEKLKDFQQLLLRGNGLSHKQLKFAASILHGSLKEKFAINGRKQPAMAPK